MERLNNYYHHSHQRKLLAAFYKINGEDVKFRLLRFQAIRRGGYITEMPYSKMRKGDIQVRMATVAKDNKSFVISQDVKLGKSVKEDVTLAVTEWKRPVEGLSGIADGRFIPSRRWKVGQGFEMFKF